MTMLFAAGAEYNSLLEWDVYTAATISAGGRSGSYSFGLPYNLGVILQKNLPARNELYLQYAFSSQNVFGSKPLVKWRAGTTVLGTVGQGSDATLKVYTGDSVTLIGSTPAILNNNVWFVFEVHIKIDDSTGIIELRVNGIPYVSFSGDTKPGSDTTINNVMSISANGGGNGLSMDDVIVNDTNGSVNNSWPNCARVGVIRPNGAGATTQLTPSTGANWSCLNEKPPSLTTYVLGNADGILDSYAMEDLPADGRVIQAIRVDGFAAKVGASAVNNLQSVIRIGSVNHPSGSNLAVPTALNLLGQIWETNPATGLPWTVADLNALEAGPQLAT